MDYLMQQRIKQLQEEKRQLEAQAAAERLRSNPFSPDYTPNHGQTYQRDPNLPPATLLPDNNDRVQNVSPFDARPTPFANKPRSPFPPGPPLKVPY